jgi:hypothetical protein
MLWGNYKLRPLSSDVLSDVYRCHIHLDRDVARLGGASSALLRPAPGEGNPTGELSATSNPRRRRNNRQRHLGPRWPVAGRVSKALCPNARRGTATTSELRSEHPEYRSRYLKVLFWFLLSELEAAGVISHAGMKRDDYV